MARAKAKPAATKAISVPSAPKSFRQRIEEVIEGRRARGHHIIHNYHGHRIEELIEAVLAIKRPDDMRVFYEGYIEYLITAARPLNSRSRAEAERIAQHNIGWCFGEGMPEVLIKRWNRATGSRHPIFGVTTPTAEEAYAAGYAWARKPLQVPYMGD